MRAFFTIVVAPIYSHIVRLIAYGPWGPLHLLLIKVFQKLYGIEWPTTLPYKTLGSFFLRDVPFELSKSVLVSPVEATALEAAERVDLENAISVKGLTYNWRKFSELPMERFKNGAYWNLYLAPHNYHWVHAASAGVNLRAYRHRGARWPVNAIGRKYCPHLYTENERLTFVWEHPQMGLVAMICVGALGVSALRCALGDVPYGAWANLKPEVQKGERLLAFELGSTVVMLVENPPPSKPLKSMLRVGDDFTGT